MPNLYILQQIRRNTNKVFSCLSRTFENSWECINKYSTKFANGFNKQIVGRITRKANKHKKCLKITCIILAILGLMTGLFMASFKSVGARYQGLQINYTEEVLKQKYFTNDWAYTGLNGYMETVPKQKIMIQFTKNNPPPSEQQKTRQIYGPIQARVSQGTKLIIEASFQCSIIIVENKDQNMKKFLEIYGFDFTQGQFGQLEWMTYLRQKITNMIIQSIATQSFYSVSNIGLKSKLNDQFGILYQPNNLVFPFQISVLSLTINYPPNSFSVNNTLGIKLLKANSLLSQLKNQYESILSYISKNSTNITDIFLQNAALSAQINKGLMEAYDFDDWLGVYDLLKTSNLAPSWPVNATVAPANITVPVNLQKFTWLYFNNIYNATYRKQTIQQALNSSLLTNQRNVFLQQQLSIY